jgi:hypothetical protein
LEGKEVHRDFFDSQNLANELPALGGTNPYPLAPTTTPLLSALLGGGPGGNNTGPMKKETHVKTHSRNAALKTAIVLTIVLFGIKNANFILLLYFQPVNTPTFLEQS